MRSPSPVLDMTRLFPLHATLDGGSYEIVGHLYGSPDRGVYRARAVHDPSPGTFLVALGGRQRRKVRDLADELTYPVVGITRLRHIGPLESEADGDWDGLVEQEPAGVPLAALRPLTARQVASVGVDLCRVLESAHDTGRGVGGLRPEMIYVRERRDELVVTQLAPRAERFLVSATLPCYPVGPMFDHIYLAPERLRESTPTPASDVFSLAALLAHLADGEHPFPAGDLGLQARAIALGRRRPLQGRFAAILERALAVDPDDRPPLGELERALADALRR